MTKVVDPALLKDVVEQQWTGRALTVNWLELEQVHRTILHEYKNGRFTAEQALKWMDEAIAAYTRRGNVL